MIFLPKRVHFVSLRLAPICVRWDHVGGGEQAILLVLRVLAVELRVEFDKLVCLLCIRQA